MTRPASYEVVYEHVWTDDAFLALPTDARLMFVWSWTNPRAAICGLYPVTMGEIAQAIGGRNGNGQAVAGPNRLAAAFDALADKPLVRYDREAGVLWVVNRARYANVSTRVAKVMRREFKTCPESPLKVAFANRYADAIGLRERSPE